MTKKIHLEGISMVSSFPYPRLDTVNEPGSTPNLWYGRCMLGYTGGKLRLFSGVKVTERIDFEDFGRGSRPTSYCPEDPEGTWDKFVCARCLKLVKKNGE